MERVSCMPMMREGIINAMRLLRGSQICLYCVLKEELHYTYLLSVKPIWNDNIGREKLHDVFLVQKNPFDLGSPFGVLVFICFIVPYYLRRC